MVDIKIRFRDRRGYVREVGHVINYSEYQAVLGRKVVGRYELLSQAQAAHPNAKLDASVKPE